MAADIRYNIKLFTDWYKENKFFPPTQNTLYARLSKFGKDFWLWGKGEKSSEIMMPLDDEDLKYLYDKYTLRHSELEEEWKQSRLKQIEEQKERLEQERIKLEAE